MMWVILIALGAVAVWPFIAESQSTRIGRPEREGTPGRFVKLSQGVTHYRWHGPARGPVIVAVHGLTTPSVVFDELAQGLGDLGYRVLTYDLYGRGLSDAPNGAQTSAFFHQQLNDLLADQGLEEDLTIMGYSMGGAIAATFAASHTDRMKRVILLASAGAALRESSFDRICSTTPFFGDWLFLLLSKRQMKRAILADQTVPPDHPVMTAQLSELDRQGYLPAVLSSRRGMLAEKTEAAHRKLGQEDVPVIAIWGRQDAVIPISSLGQVSQWNRNTLQEVIDAADHTFPYSNPDEVVARLRDVLRERD